MRHLLSLFILLSLPVTGFASTESELSSTLEALDATRSQEAELSGRLDEVKDQLQTLLEESGQLVDTVRELQTMTETNRDELKLLAKQLAAKQGEVDAQRDEVAKLLHGMIRLQRMPRHYVMAQPGDSTQLLRAASALSITYDVTARRIHEAVQSYTELNALSEELTNRQAQFERDLANLQAKRHALKETVAERRSLQRTLQRDHARVKTRVDRLSEQSQSLRELIARLESETMLFKELGVPQAKPKAPSRDAILFASRKGMLPYPASGRFLHRFGDKRGKDEPYQGMVILTAANAPITVPHKGKVVFSGSFMDYGRMIIIQHDEQYHSVIAGLDVIEVEPGQPVATNEPIGVMGSTIEDRKLYFELRKHSKAIDPTEWMGNLRNIASR